MWCFFEKYRFWVKCCGIVWSVLAVIFSFYTMTFFLGNHDFRFVRYGMPVLSGVFEGRFSQFLPPYFLTVGQMLPVLNVWLGFLFLSVGVVLLAKWYGFEEKTQNIFCFCLLIVLNPYFLTQLYYVHSILSICVWHCLSIVGIILIYEGVAGRMRVLLAGVLCLVLSFGGYASSMELAAVVLLGKIWLNVLSDKKVDRAGLIFYLKIGLWCLVSLLIYLQVIEQLKAHRLLNLGMYNVQTLSMGEIWRKFLREWNEPFRVLALALPVCGRVIGVGSGLFCVLVIAVSCERRRFILSFVLGLGLVYASFGVAYISPYDFFYIYRIHAFSVPYFWAILFAVVCLKGKVWWRNIAVGLACLMLIEFIGANFEIQKVWYLGNEQNERLVERVRQDIIPFLEDDKHYRLATLGDMSGQIKFSSMRNKNLSVGVKDGSHEFASVEYFLPIFFSSGLFLYETENPIWADAILVGTKFFFSVSNERVAEKDTVIAGIFAQSFGDDKKEMLEALSKMRPYPHPNYYFIGKKDIFLMFSENGTNKQVLMDNIRNSRKN